MLPFAACVEILYTIKIHGKKFYKILFLLYKYGNQMLRRGGFRRTGVEILYKFLIHRLGAES